MGPRTKTRPRVTFLQSLPSLLVISHNRAKKLGNVIPTPAPNLGHESNGPKGRVCLKLRESLGPPPVNSKELSLSLSINTYTSLSLESTEKPEQRNQRRRRIRRRSAKIFEIIDGKVSLFRFWSSVVRVRVSDFDALSFFFCSPSRVRPLPAFSLGLGFLFFFGLSTVFFSLFVCILGIAESAASRLPELQASDRGWRWNR